MPGAGERHALNSESPAPCGKTSLVGRQREMAALRERLESAATGDGGVVFVHGEAGIGKSRLLRELTGLGRASGWIVATGRAYDSEGMPPYLPFADIVRECLRAFPGDKAQSLIEQAPEIASLIPELRIPMPQPRRGVAWSSETARYRLFETTSDLLIEVARSVEARGLLLCLDDLHWADKGTLLLLAHLARKIGGAPLLLVGTHRTAGVDRSHPLFTAIAEVERERRCIEIGLGPLSLEDADALAMTLNGGARIAPQVLRVLHERTAGNPFFIEEVMRHFSAAGLDPGDASVAAEVWGLPESVRQVVGARLSRLAPETHRLLEVAAVLGDEFSLFFPVAERMLGADTRALARGVEECVRAGILAQEGPGYQFAHALVRDALLDQMSPPRRQALHLTAAEAIEETLGDGGARHLSTVAMHYRQAGPFAPAEKAIDFSLRAGEAANKSLAYEEAQVHWEAALSLMARHHIGDEEVVRLVEKLGELMQVIGYDRYAKGIAYFEQAIALHVRMRDHAGAAAMHARLGLLLGAGSAVNDNHAALRHLHAAEPQFRDGPPSDAQLSLFSGLGLVAVWMVNTREGLDASRRAMEVALAIGSEDRWVTNAVMHAHHLNALGQIDEGLQLMARAWETADRLDNTYRSYVAAAWLGGRLYELGDPRPALDWYEREIGQPRLRHAPARRSELHTNMSIVFACSGDLERSRLILAETGLRVPPEVAFMEGDWERAETTWARRVQAAPAALFLSAQASAGLWLARAKRLRGDCEAATHALADVLEIGVNGPSLLIEMPAAAELALARAHTGAISEAQAHLERVREILAAGANWRGLAGRAALAEGAVALAAGSPGAGSHFEHAIEDFRAHSLPWDEADAFEVWARLGGRLHRSRTRRAFVAEKLSHAREVYERIGAARPWLARLETLARELCGDGESAPEAVRPAGLTSREVEVLGLLAAGASSKEIGEQLVLSVRTVERHIANIYLKTGAHGRAQAASYAISHHLDNPGR
ncbi:MAG: AAA family ATPase [Thermoflexaceae bacterium]|nr:AAA family ATPase [Thermoflexaceae bacterium]